MSLGACFLPKSVHSPALPRPSSAANTVKSLECPAKYDPTFAQSLAQVLVLAHQRHLLLTAALIHSHSPLFALTWHRRVGIQEHVGSPTCHTHSHKRITFSSKVHQSDSQSRQYFRQADFPIFPRESGPDSICACATQTLSAETALRLKSLWYHFRSRPACPRGLAHLGSKPCSIGPLAHAASVNP